MAEPPHYDSKCKLYPPVPSSAPSHCSCHTSPAVINQRCPRCTHHSNANLHWHRPHHPSSPGFNPLPARPIYPSPTNYLPHPPTSYPPSTPTSYPPQPPPYRPPSTTCPGVCIPPSKFGVKPYYWVDTTSHGGVPSTALLGGHDIDGARIFVGRAFHEGDWIPAKVIPDRNVAYVAHGGGEHAKHQYQVLCEQRFDWVPSSGGHIPPGAVEGGRTVDGEPLYVGRVHHSGATTVGKVHPSHGVCYIPFDGKEMGHHNYEILVLRN